MQGGRCVADLGRQREMCQAVENKDKIKIGMGCGGGGGDTQAKCPGTGCAIVIEHSACLSSLMWCNMWSSGSVQAPVVVTGYRVVATRLGIGGSRVVCVPQGVVGRQMRRRCTGNIGSRMCGRGTKMVRSGYMLAVDRYRIQSGCEVESWWLTVERVVGAVICR